jgi:hypothetical protein
MTSISSETGISAGESAQRAAVGIHKVLEYVISHFCILLGLVTLSTYSFLSQFGMLPASITSDKVLLSFLFTLALFLLGFSDKVRSDLVKVEESLDIYNEDRASIHIITSQAELYELMTEKIRTAKKSVCIMHLDQFPPTHFMNEARTAYFKFIFDFGKRNENILMRRITSINEREKGEWVKEKMIETQKTENLNIAYINTEKLDSTSLKTVVSCQLVDDDKVFILNPLSNTVSGNGHFPNCVYIENKKVAEVYQKYYDTLWNYAELGYNKCQMLKDGKDCNFDVIDRIIEDLSGEDEKPTPSPSKETGISMAGIASVS